MTTARCRGFTVYPPSVFYPIHYKQWRKYFEIRNSNTTLKTLSKAKAIHVWNKLSKDEKVRVDSNVPYAVIARKYCPRVFNNCGKIFWITLENVIYYWIDRILRILYVIFAFIWNNRKRERTTPKKRSRKIIMKPNVLVQ